MKFRFTASAWSNVSYKIDKVIDVPIDLEEWNEMCEEEQREMLHEVGHEEIFNDIDWSLEPDE